MRCKNRGDNQEVWTRCREDEEEAKYENTQELC